MTDIKEPLIELEDKPKRGLASASATTRSRVAQSGGTAPHEKRGLQAADEDTRSKVARMGGLARALQRKQQHK